MKYYIIAGEASGDLHGSMLMNELKMIDPLAEFRFWGGNLMLNESTNIAKHISDTAFMGILEVVLNLKQIKRNFAFCETDLLIYHPDLIIFIDYPGFNLRMAKFAKAHSFKTAYYISPKVWAWKTKRVFQIKKYIDKMYCILPFEEEFYKNYNYNVEYIGNPLFDKCMSYLQHAISKNDFLKINNLPNKDYIALLPGSRVQEIKTLLPLVTQLCNEYKNINFVITGMSAIDNSLYTRHLLYNNLFIVYDQTYDTLIHCKAAIVTSGTAVLEAALLGTKQIAIYKTSFLTFEIGKRIVNLKYATLPNIILGKEMVKEILQYNIIKRLKKTLNILINDSSLSQQFDNDRSLLIEKLNKPNAAKNAALSIYNFLKN